ncbi:hypothetical protein JCM8202v2_000210 [Rhodotorula sphaerocarpa]
MFEDLGVFCFCPEPHLEARCFRTKKEGPNKGRLFWNKFFLFNNKKEDYGWEPASSFETPPPSPTATRKRSANTAASEKTASGKKPKPAGPFTSPSDSEVEIIAYNGKEPPFRSPWPLLFLSKKSLSIKLEDMHKSEQAKAAQEGEEIAGFATGFKAALKQEEGKLAAEKAINASLKAQLAKTRQKYNNIKSLHSRIQHQLDSGLKL